MRKRKKLVCTIIIDKVMELQLHEAANGGEKVQIFRP